MDFQDLLETGKDIVCELEYLSSLDKCVCFKTFRK